MKKDQMCSKKKCPMLQKHSLYHIFVILENVILQDDFPENTEICSNTMKNNEVIFHVQCV